LPTAVREAATAQCGAKLSFIRMSLFLGGHLMRLVTFKELGPLYGIWFSRTHLKRMMDPESRYYAEFPNPVSKTTGRLFWRSTDIEAWVRSFPELLSRSLPKKERKKLSPPQGPLPNYSQHNVED
jgi:predicted DNA-binding transcriptional regulator AlpA